MWYKKLFVTFGHNSKIFGKIKVYNPKKIHVGNNSTINEGVLLNARESIVIGNHVHISPYVIINTGGLCYQSKMEERKHSSFPVVVEDGVWIGSGAIINPGIIIGKNSVIGAGSIVTKDVVESVVVAGNPAKIIKKIT